MSITVQCGGCSTKVQVPDDAAGRRGKCRKCGATVTIPAAAASEESKPLAISSKCSKQFPYAKVIDMGGVITCRDCLKPASVVSQAQTRTQLSRLTLWELRPLSALGSVWMAGASVAIVNIARDEGAAVLLMLLITVPLAIALGFRFWSKAKLDERFGRQGGGIPHWLKLVVGTGVAVFVLALTVASISESRAKQQETERKAKMAEEERQAGLAASQERRDKASKMRDSGFNGSDEELSRMYDRVKGQADAKTARDERLKRP